ncbi:ictacalcin-like, partial [Anolis sagrei]|uniref:ictacalcin-like n=1 Tax=Anolis sagrei TaxID=38937 RepID=UPI003520422C
MPYLLDSLCTIIGVFYEHAKRHGDSSTLNKREMKRLILKEFADVIENPRDHKTVELTFQMLDTNGDGLVDFNEYLLLILKVAEACYTPLKPREDLGKIERSTAECVGEQRQNNRNQVEDNARTGRSIRERGDSEQRYLPPTEGTERGQERRNCHPPEPETPVDEGSHQDLERRDHCGRDRPS